MKHYSLLLLGILSIFFVPIAAEMTCNINGVLKVCPTFLDNFDQKFCCESDLSDFSYCCDFGEYVRKNSAAAAAIVIATVVVGIIILICCCCFCSCCYLAKRRVQGQVIYLPATGQASIPPYQQVHPPPASQMYSQQAHNPNYATAQHQAPINYY